MSSWLTKITESHAEVESPEIFFYWSGMAAMSAVIKKNIYLNRFIYKLYPNIYVFLVAQSGGKKGIPVAFARDIIEMTKEVRIIQGRSSMPKILQELGKAYTLENGAIIKDAQAIIISGELASLLVKDPDALTVFTDIYNTHEHEKEWKNSLKGTGTDTLKSPCITLLGATNEEHFVNAVPQADVKGGFIARTFIVLSEERPKINALTEAPKAVVDKSCFVDHLNNLSKIKGEMKWSDAGKKLFRTWYEVFMAEIKDDPTGTYNRIGDQVLKAAMLISLAESFNLILEDRHIDEAITVSLKCAQGMKKITMGQGQSTTSHVVRIILRELIAAPNNRMKRETLLQRHWGEFDHFELDRAIETLIGCDALDFAGGKKIEYIAKKKFLDIYTTNIKSIM